MIMATQTWRNKLESSTPSYQQVLDAMSKRKQEAEAELAKLKLLPIQDMDEEAADQHGLDMDALDVEIDNLSTAMGLMEGYYCRLIYSGTPT